VTGNVGTIRKEWIKRSSTIGKNVTITTTTGTLKGKVTGIDKTGALILSRNGIVQHVLAGDMTYN